MVGTEIAQSWSPVRNRFTVHDFCSFDKDSPYLSAKLLDRTKLPRPPEYTKSMNCTNALHFTAFQLCDTVH